MLMLSCLQANLREALLSHSVAYSGAYLAALAAAMTRGASAAQEEPVLPECLRLLLQDLEEQRGGSEYLSQALHTASLLLSLWPGSRLDRRLYYHWRKVQDLHSQALICLFVQFKGSSAAAVV